MKEIELKEKDFLEIKSHSVQNWINYNRGETTLVQAVINSFVAFCNKKGYIVKDGKVFSTNEKLKKERNS